MAAEGELKLLGTWASPYVSRVKLALHLKGQSYEYVVEEDHFNNKSELLLSSNPVHKKVPVMIHNGKPICESLIIMEYIDEAFPCAEASLLPADPHDRAVARFWATYIDDKLVPSWKQAFSGKTGEEKAEGMSHTLAAVDALEAAMEECSSKGKPFFGGDTVGYLDVALGGLLSWLHGTEELCGAKILDAAKTPLLSAWARRFGELDAAKVALPDVGKLVKFAKMRRAQLEAAMAAATVSRN
uniref:Glutathione S-transferase n=1 Tax=Oryza punctata TaxID=4537 RepID=A0A0E0MA19_ORYPU